MSSVPHQFLPGAELDDGRPVPDGLTVDLSTKPMDEMVDGVRMTQIGDGIEVDFEPGVEAQNAVMEHGANLAEGMDEGLLSRIAAEVEEWVEADIKSREAWHSKLADGLELLGLTRPKQSLGAFKLTDKVNHPVIAEAAVQFQARAIAELVPSEGPAKAMIVGDRTQAREEQAERVAEYMNYRLMVTDKTYYRETDQMLFVLAKNGSQFKKVYRDDLLQQNVSRWVRGEDFIVPYGVTSLESAPRYTHQIQVSRNDMKKLQKSGFYRDVALSTPSEGPSRSDTVVRKQDEAQGQEDAGKLLLDEQDHTDWECHCYYDLKGFEDKDDLGQNTGIGLPYVITVDKESRTTLSIRRNWKEADELKRKRLCFVHYSYLPGDGFYSYGSIHFIGGLGFAATGLLKAIILGVAFAGMQGGFKSKDTKLPGNVELEFGKWIDTDMTAEELSKAFYTPPFKEPGEAGFKVLEFILGAAQRFSSTTESMVGDASNTGPVGTTVALIEQGSKVYTGIHRRLHQAAAEELQLLAELEEEHMPPEGYPYDVHGESRQVFREDFDGRVDVVPVSDPNIFSSTQRIAIAQTLVQRADMVPAMYDRRKVEKRFLEAMRVPDADDVLIDKSKIQRCDPVTENMLLTVGRPVKAVMDQDHDAHIALHMDMLHRLEAEKSPLLEQIAPQAMAHVAEHYAYGMRVKAMMAMGAPLPPVNLDAEDGEPVTPPLSPQIENQIAQRAAMAIQRMQIPGDEDAKKLQQQAEAIQKEAQALEEQKKQIAAAANQAQRERLQADSAKRELALKAELVRVQQACAARELSANTKAIVEQAISHVEAAITGMQEKKA